jgi:hypothetical protein
VSPSAPNAQSRTAHIRPPRMPEVDGDSQHRATVMRVSPRLGGRRELDRTTFGRDRPERRVP